MTPEKQKILRSLKRWAIIKSHLSERSMLEIAQQLRLKVEEMNQGYLVRRSKNQLAIKFTILINCD